MYDCRGQSWSPIDPDVHHHVYDVVGIGFGPSGLALAIAIEEHDSLVGPAEAISARFVERRPRFGSDRGTLLPGTSMAFSFLDDLATPRNPATSFSLVTYLRDRGRLPDCIDHESAHPSRIEFHGYLEWLAERLEHLVSYDREVVDVRPVIDGSRVVCFDVVGRDGEIARGRNLVLATGRTPTLPEGIERSERIWHTSELLPRLAVLALEPPRRFVVVGAGQSAAETAAHLHDRLPNAEICSVFSGYGYCPADDSPFAEQTFEISRRTYEEKVHGQQRLRFVNASYVTDVHETDDDAVAVIRSLAHGRTSMLRADAIVFATGCEPSDPGRTLGSAAAYCRRDACGDLRIGCDHRVRTTAHVEGAIYVQGASRHPHGAAPSLPSNTAVRAGKILGSLLARDAGASCASEPLCGELGASHVPVAERRCDRDPPGRERPRVGSPMPSDAAICA